MPITQDRLISLIEIIDETLTSREQLARTAAAELDEALNEFYAANGNANALACNIMAHLQSLAVAVETSPLSHKAIETLAREREHFRTKRSSNIIAARSMARRRRKSA